MAAPLRALAPLLLAAACAACAAAPEGNPPLDPAEDPPTTHDGIALAVTDVGRGAPALVFVHGWACDRSFWAPQIASFTAHHRVVAPDLPGHGDTGGERARWSVADYGRDVADLVRQLELDDVVLVGHSMGGPVCVDAAARLGGRVRGVVGVDCLHDPDWSLDAAQWDAFMQGWERDYRGQMETFVRQLTPQDADEEQVERILEAMASTPQEVAVPLMRSFGELDQAALLERLEVPLVLLQDADGMPTAEERLRELVPWLRVVPLQGVGHFPMLERPADFDVALSSALLELSE